MDQYNLDALVMLTNSPPWPVDLVNGDPSLGGSSQPAALAGYPAITVPAGYVFGLPVGITFITTTALFRKRESIPKASP